MPSTLSTKVISLLFLCFLSQIAMAQLVTDATQLRSAIASAGPGATIILADGIWKDVFIDIDKEGTATAPITITAQNAGGVLMTGNSRVYMEGSYLTVTGLVFQDPENLVTSGSNIEPVIELKRCDNCKVLNNKIDSYNGTEAQKELTFKWILADGQYNEIAYNSFVGKYGVGSIINDNRNSADPDYLSIHHNYFADRTPINEINGDNDQDAIRIGNSGTSLDDSFTEVYDNYFYNFFGEIEVISNKSGQNKYYNNTFRAYSGALTLRHGNGCEVYNNYFFAEDNLYSGGVRVIGEDHKIYNNYIQGVNSTKPGGSRSSGTGGINVSNGRENTAINGYYQVRNTEVVNNTFVNCDYALRVGTKVSSDLTLPPVNLTIANNITFNTSINDYQITTEPIENSISEGNILGLGDTELVDDGNFYRLAGTSTAINAGIGDYSFLNEDILGGTRGDIIDAGAEEYNGGGMRLPYNNIDVGVTVGFGATSGPTLAVLPNLLTFGRYADTMTFDVIANVDWTIEENTPWLDIETVAGSGTTSIVVTVEENPTGEDREATVTIKEAAGGSGLTTDLAVIQLNTFLPSEIKIVGATSLGKEDKAEITNENAYDDDITTYWTGNPDDEDEVSITFDLGCRHVLTDIGINFWKADERTTSFSIAVANKSDGPFNTIINNATSDSNNTLDTEQFFSLGGTIAQYVKFIGIGNSSSSNWTSIANVNIYGDVNCDTTVGIEPVAVTKNPLLVFPVPASDVLNIKSDNKGIGQISILNSNGQVILKTNDDIATEKQIDISALSSGLYFIKTNEFGLTKFIVI